MYWFTAWGVCEQPINCLSLLHHYLWCFKFYWKDEKCPDWRCQSRRWERVYRLRFPSPFCINKKIKKKNFFSSFILEVSLWVSLHIVLGVRVSFMSVTRVDPFSSLLANLWASLQSFLKNMLFNMFSCHAVRWVFRWWTSS